MRTRWARRILLLTASALVGGLLFAAYDIAFGRGTRNNRRRFEEALQDSKHPYWNTIELRFVVGCVLGAGVGLRIVRGNSKREEP